MPLVVSRPDASIPSRFPKLIQKPIGYNMAGEVSAAEKEASLETAAAMLKQSHFVSANVARNAFAAGELAGREQAAKIFQEAEAVRAAKASEREEPIVVEEIPTLKTWAAKEEQTYGKGAVEDVTPKSIIGEPKTAKEAERQETLIEGMEIQKEKDAFDNQAEINRIRGVAEEQARQRAAEKKIDLQFRLGDVAIKWGLPIAAVGIGLYVLPSIIVKGLASASDTYAALPEDQQIMIAVAIALAISLVIAYAVYKLMGAKTAMSSPAPAPAVAA